MSATAPEPAPARTVLTLDLRDPLTDQSPHNPLAGLGGTATAERPSGRGSVTDPDVIQGRPYRADAVPALGQQPEIPEQMRASLPPASQMPRTILRFDAENELLISGMLAGGRELAGKPAIVDVPKGKGHIVMFANNPMWRFETQGSFFLLFNAMLHFDHLDVGKPRTAASSPQR